VVELLGDLILFLYLDNSSYPLLYDAALMVFPRELSATVSPSAYPCPSSTAFVDIMYNDSERPMKCCNILLPKTNLVAHQQLVR
jgi:hypothetical protein